MAKGKKTGGRTAGTPNKKTQSLLQMCDELNFNPFKAMLKIAADDTHDQQGFMLKEVCQYLYPKRKSLEHSGNISPELAEAAEGLQELSKDEQIKLLEEQLKELKKHKYEI